MLRSVISHQIPKCKFAGKFTNLLQKIPTQKTALQSTQIQFSPDIRFQNISFDENVQISPPPPRVLKYSFVHFSHLKNDPCHSSNDKSSHLLMEKFGVCIDSKEQKERENNKKFHTKHPEKCLLNFYIQCNLCTFSGLLILSVFSIHTKMTFGSQREITIQFSERTFCFMLLPQWICNLNNAVNIWNVNVWLLH